MTQQEYGTARQVAERYNTSAWVIRKRVAEGTLPAVRVGPRSLRINWATAARVFGDHAHA
ncbi:hypothetical protein [Arthrobacter sp. UYEF36]|uniref:hypothetical protein n=1 Tax=Arthrobacter sp. UYEF36 TaxID=1756366 RepID=UPI0033931EDC